MKIELSGGHHGGELEEVKELPANLEFVIERDGRRYLYRYVPDETRSSHATYCGEMKDAIS